MELEHSKAEEAQISRAEFKAWREDKVTAFIMQELTNNRDGWMMYLANGNTIKLDSDISTDFVVGRIQGLNDFVLVEYEEDPDKVKAETRDRYGY